MFVTLLYTQQASSTPTTPAEPITTPAPTRLTASPQGQDGHSSSAVPMAVVGPGTYRPLYGDPGKSNAFPVAAFELDPLPVTNGQFLAFVRSHPQWRRSQVASGVYADAHYLAHWATDEQLASPADTTRPVVHVSWFAARAYCKSQGKRLPLEAEWELAAAANTTERDASLDTAWQEQILAWYARPNSGPLASVGKSHAPNAWGVWDLHGLVWEWVADFNNGLVSGDSRDGADSGERFEFCGAGALKATQKISYATFMRLAFRSSLQASYTTAGLGFRCARALSTVQNTRGQGEQKP